MDENNCDHCGKQKPDVKDRGSYFGQWCDDCYFGQWRDDCWNE